MTVTPHRDEASWLAFRRRHLTASDVGPLLGVYPSERSRETKNPFATWRVKTGQAEEPDASGMRLRFDLGHLVEPRIRQEIEAREPGVKVLSLGRYVTIDDGFLSSTPDGVVVPDTFRSPGMYGIEVEEGDGAPRLAKITAALEAALAVVEIKSDATIQQAKGWAEGGKFDYSLVQLHVGMMTTTIGAGRIALCAGLGLDFDLWPVVRSPELSSLILERAQEFWEHVLTGTPPSAKFLDDSEAIGKSLAAIYAKDSGETIDLDEAAALQLDHYQEQSKIEKAAKASKRAIKNAVMARMGAASWARVPGSGKKWQWRNEKTEKYTVAASESRVLRVVND